MTHVREVQQEGVSLDQEVDLANIDVSVSDSDDDEDDNEGNDIVKEEIVVNEGIGVCMPRTSQRDALDSNIQASSMNQMSLNKLRKSLMLKMQFVRGSSGQEEIHVEREPDAADYQLTSKIVVSRNELMHLIQEGIRMVLLKRSPTSNKVRSTRHKQMSQSSNQTIKYQFNMYRPSDFHKIRRLTNLASLEIVESVCDDELFGGDESKAGKSGSLFWFSANRRFVLKSVEETEAATLLKLCSSMSHYLSEHPNSLLVRFFGLFRMIVGKRNIYLVLMNNIFSSQSAMHEIFDLKGTTESRYVRFNNNPTPMPGDDRIEHRTSGENVLKDLNFTGNFINLIKSTCASLKNQLEQDSLFLRKHDIMDYSLLLGVYYPSDKYLYLHKELLRQSLVDYLERQETNSSMTAPSNLKKRLSVIKKGVDALQDKLMNALGKGNHQASKRRASTSGQIYPTSKFAEFQGGVPGLAPSSADAPCIYYIGIIDVLTKYTIKKKMAHAMKKYTIGCCHEIDTEPPVYYQPRFLKFIESRIRSCPHVDINRIVKEAAARRIQTYYRLTQRAKRNNRSSSS